MHYAEDDVDLDLAERCLKSALVDFEQELSLLYVRAAEHHFSLEFPLGSCPGTWLPISKRRKAKGSSRVYALYVRRNAEPPANRKRISRRGSSDQTLREKSQKVLLNSSNHSHCL